MPTLFLILLVVGVAPLCAGLIRVFRGARPVSPFKSEARVLISSTLICTLAFNLTFFWQELWLVIPKALTPGLYPTLYHNNHAWSGTSPYVNLLQGTGALATLVSGSLSMLLSCRSRPRGAFLKMLLFWLAFQGLFQALAQVVIGAFMPANDLGMAMAYLKIGRLNIVVAAMGVLAIAAAGAGLARIFPIRNPSPSLQRRDAFYYAAIPAFLSVLFTIPFRVPRNAIEVVFVPLLTAIVGSGWMLAMDRCTTRTSRGLMTRAPLKLPFAALCALLLFFQLVLRRGISF